MRVDDCFIPKLELGEGIEPSKVSRPSDLQSDSFGRLDIPVRNMVESERIALSPPACRAGMLLITATTPKARHNAANLSDTRHDE